MTIYADELFAANALSLLMLMYSYCILNRIKPRHFRFIGGAAVCGVYAVAEVWLRLPYILRAAALSGIVYICFGRRNILRHTSHILLLSFAAMGITLAAASALGLGAELIKGYAVIFSAEPVGALIYILSYPVYILAQKLRRIQKKYVHITIFHNGSSIKLRALYDSGNLLKYHGKPVLLLSWDAASPLFECGSYVEMRDMSDQFVLYETISGLGTLPVVEPDKCFADGVPRDLAAAAASSAICLFKNYRRECYAVSKKDHDTIYMYNSRKER